MLDISKANQFISPGQEFSLSSFGPSDKSKIQFVRGESTGGGLSTWSPKVALPSLTVLKANRAYLFQSVLSGGSFVAYSLGVVPGGFHAQNNQITKLFQFLTYRGESSFGLNSLEASVKSKISRIYGPASTAAGGLRIWQPDVVLPTLSYLIPGNTYLIESEASGFSAYDLGIPTDASSSSSSSVEPEMYFVNYLIIPDKGLMPDMGMVPDIGLTP